MSLVLLQPTANSEGSAHADGEAIFLLGVKGDAVGPCAPLHGAPYGAGHGARQVGRARRNRPEITQ